MGDVYFDLANFAVNNGLPDEDDDRAAARVLRRRRRREHERALTLMRFMSDFREAMWGVVQQALSDLDFDFRAYADAALRAARANRRRARRSGAPWARLALREENCRSRRRVREHRDGRNDLEGRVHRHENAYRQRPDTA